MKLIRPDKLAEILAAGMTPEQEAALVKKQLGIGTPLEVRISKLKVVEI